ncbi:endoplasmic reticulum lectin 1-like isoform X1 [Ruditapes philippinarum]|uniref:endoplasmic reticulum lectin 1-like isoform X1 n=1 Tax=Ruditapes philippinarum TaxID=129788 RepID=UPI00295B23A3|nr:endoplasmic reticulum lectin 1-like isoform X1 [Ruditapes philippinarum]
MNVLSFISFISLVSAGGINPFSDDDLFAINWAGTVDIDRLKTENSDVEIVSVQTEEDEKYQCVIPESQATIDANRKATYNGATPEELMEALFLQSSCSYRIESYWTYELCHGKHIKQYHDNKELGLQKPKLQEYYLGQISKTVTEDNKKTGVDKSGTVNKGDGSPRMGMEKDEVGGETGKGTEEVAGKDDNTRTTEKKQQEIRSVKIDGLDLPFFSVNMTDGTVCDLTGKPRQSHIKYICQPNGRGEIYQLKETSSCEYDIIVLTAVLCQHPAFKPKDPPVSKINCHSVGTSPRQPLRLTKLQREQGIRLEPVDEEDEEEEEVQQPPKKQTGFKQEHIYESQKPVKVETNIGKEADKQLLRDFINGDYCIHGGGGWWKHEFCYNKHAKQYHEESSSSVTTIYLGHWDKQKHLDWLQRNPAKKPKQPENRKLISLYYSGGDVCDLTNKQRFVEVKLKCLNNAQQPHAVAIYLVEPASCEYVLGVESPLFCGLLEKADENGLFDHINV